MFVQFEDETMQRVISVFSSAQDPELYQNQSEIEWGDVRLQSYYSAQIPFVQVMLDNLKG